MSFISLVGSPLAFAPIAFEYSMSSLMYVILILKPTPRGNFSCLLASSVFKLLAAAAVFTTNLTPFGIANIPFLLFQLLNEVTILIWSIQRRDQIVVTNISRMYNARFRALRVIGEFFTMTIICSIGVLAPFEKCPCQYTVQKILDGLFLPICKDPSSLAMTIATILTPQVRGLAFVISITAGAVSMSGIQFMVAGFTARIKGKQSKAIDFMGEDQEWKRKIRGIYSGLVIVVAFSFLGTYLLPGFRQCEADDFLEDIEDEAFMRYNLGPLSSTLFNAILAISQMFVSDILFRATAQAKKSSEIDSKDIEDDSSS